MASAGIPLKSKVLQGNLLSLNESAFDVFVDDAIFLLNSRTWVLLESAQMQVTSDASVRLTSTIALKLSASYKFFVHLQTKLHKYKTTLTKINYIFSIF